jgi:hypothetical protein
MPKNPSNIARLVPSSASDAEAPPVGVGVPRTSLVGECIDARHPLLAGRVRVRWATPEATLERWLPTLRGVAVQEQDRVLLLETSAESDPIVVGVIDGCAPRETEQRPSSSLVLAADDVFTVRAENGTPLLEIARNAEGPVVRLLTRDTQLELPGQLRIHASDIELSARRGSVRIEASEEVVVQGEMIRLN